MRFSKPWLPVSVDQATKTPVLDVFLRAGDGTFVRQTLIVDSGADVGMGPRALCELLGLTWEDGELVTLRGISPRDECAVASRMQLVELYIREARCRITIPFCFADGDAPLLLGRDGFFDAFRVLFDKGDLATTFELVESQKE